MDAHHPWDSLVRDIVHHVASPRWAAIYWANGAEMGMDKTLRRLLQRRMTAWRTEYEPDLWPNVLPRTSMIGLSVLGYAASKSPVDSSTQDKIKEHAVAWGVSTVLPLWQWLYQDSIRRQWTDATVMAHTARLSGIPILAQDLRNAPVLNIEKVVSPHTHQWISTALVLGVQPSEETIRPPSTPLPHLEHSV